MEYKRLYGKDKLYKFCRYGPFIYVAVVATVAAARALLL
jgi:hypothetical protein